MRLARFNADLEAGGIEHMETSVTPTQVFSFSL